MNYCFSRLLPVGGKGYEIDNILFTLQSFFVPTSFWGRPYLVIAPAAAFGSHFPPAYRAFFLAYTDTLATGLCFSVVFFMFFWEKYLMSHHKVLGSHLSNCINNICLSQLWSLYSSKTNIIFSKDLSHLFTVPTKMLSPTPLYPTKSISDSTYGPSKELGVRIKSLLVMQPWSHTGAGGLGSHRALGVPNP